VRANVSGICEKWNGTFLWFRRLFANVTISVGGTKMGRGLLLWLIGIPLPIILLIWLFGGLN
jgi:hypothetical protein